jgi:hypothetical protein
MTSSLLGLLVLPDEDFDPKENNHSGGERGQKHSARQIALRRQAGNLGFDCVQSVLQCVKILAQKAIFRILL